MELDNPVLSELDSLSPHAKNALAQAHGKLLTLSSGGAPLGPAPDAGASAAPKLQPLGNPSEQPPSAPGMLPTIGGAQQQQQSPGMLPTLAQPSPTVAGDRAELSRLNTTGSGVSQIHNPFLKTLGVIGDAVGTGLFPRIAAQVPGTTAHHQQLVGAAGQQLKADEGVETEAAKNELTGAQAAEQASLPQYHQSQAELGATKAALTQEKQNEAEQHHKSQNSAQLAQHGFKEDENGKIVPLGYEEMSEPQQAVHDLSASRQELYEATSALKKAQKDNQPAMMRMAQQRIDNANRNAGIAAQRLGLSEKQFEMRAHGTENGEALPGAILGDDNKPVGTAFQQNVRPTGQERNKADLASSAREQLGDIADIMTKRKDIFGPVNGRKTDFSVWLGSQDPDAQKFRAARTIAADHLAGVFGGRSEAALSALDNAVGQFRDNPEAAIAGVKQLDKANTRFIEKGTPKTAGSNAAKGSGATPNVTTKAQYDALPKGAEYMEDGKKYRKP